MSAVQAPVAAVVRTRIRVEGTVQGVGFRPFVVPARAASSGSLATSSTTPRRPARGRGAAGRRGAVLARLRDEAPPLAVIEPRQRSAPAPDRRAAASGSRRARARAPPNAPVTPDAATCADCLRELFDPADRRYRYPFINCTNCGPRFTIVRGVPYDRPLTTMAAFSMCDACRTRVRGSARPALPRPAERLSGVRPAAVAVRSRRRRWSPSASRRCRGRSHALRVGRIVAIKGIGGFHLACRADDEDAVATLRARKHREDKPFALMAADLEAAPALVSLTAPRSELLSWPRAPDRARAAGRPDAAVAGAVAPRSPRARRDAAVLAASPPAASTTSAARW